MENTFEQIKSSLLSAEEDEVAAMRKKDHIEMAFKSQVAQKDLDQRFYYEPLLSGHPDSNALAVTKFLGKKMKAPIWVSSMTGGTKEAFTINHNLARACKEFGLGMGLGSCRALLYGKERLADFDLRSIIGSDQPLYANLGIAQLEELVEKKSLARAEDLVALLQADGLIIHVNPFQEWLQPEGDHFKTSPLAVIEECLTAFSFPIIVKEVGQGMGPKSLAALMALPLAAIDFAASGGTNFALLELLRANEQAQEQFGPLAQQGHGALEMIGFVNDLLDNNKESVRCKEFIISGGVKTFLDGYFYTNQLNANCIYGQASGFLKHARGDYQELQEFVSAQIAGLSIANAFLTIR